MQHHVGFGKQFGPAQRNEFRVARAGADQVGLALARRPVTRPIQGAGHGALGGAGTPREHVFDDRSAENVEPEALPRAAVRQAANHGVAPACGKSGQFARAGRQDALDARLQPAGERR